MHRSVTRGVLGAVLLSVPLLAGCEHREHGVVVERERPVYVEEEPVFVGHHRVVHERHEFRHEEHRGEEHHGGEHEHGHR